MASTTTVSLSTIFKLSIALVFSIIVSLCVGAYALLPSEILQILLSYLPVGNWDVNESSAFLLMHIRLPRIFLALIVGGGLAISGAAIQVVFRNPLAEPGLIGISSGAMLMAVGYIVLRDTLPFTLSPLLNYLGLSIAAFLGGITSTVLVYKLSTRAGRTSIATMLLGGIAITALAGGITGVFIFYAGEAQLRDITFWNFGSVSGSNWWIVGWLSLITIIGTYKITQQARQLEILQLGDDEAAYLGVDVQKIKKQVIVWVVLIVGTCVAFTGLIGFVGLVVPHLVRMYYKNAAFAQRVIYTGLLGAILLGIADMIARTIVAPAELPIGILTALIGAPFFLWLLVEQNKKLY